MYIKQKGSMEQIRVCRIETFVLVHSKTKPPPFPGRFKNSVYSV